MGVGGSWCVSYGWNGHIESHIWKRCSKIFRDDLLVVPQLTPLALSEATLPTRVGFLSFGLGSSAVLGLVYSGATVATRVHPFLWLTTKNAFPRTRPSQSGSTPQLDRVKEIDPKTKSRT